MHKSLFELKLTQSMLCVSVALSKQARSLHYPYIRGFSIKITTETRPTTRSENPRVASLILHLFLGKSALLPGKFWFLEQPSGCNLY